MSTQTNAFGTTASRTTASSTTGTRHSADDVDLLQVTDFDAACKLVPRGTELPCHTVGPDLWFAESPADVEAAKALCSTCPLRTACLASALERGEPWGVWGGQLVVAGEVVAKKRPRGRPRKTELAA